MPALFPCLRVSSGSESSDVGGSVDGVYGSRCGLLRPRGRRGSGITSTADIELVLLSRPRR